MKKEIWKDIKDYEGLYQVSNMGNIRSLDRVLPYKKNSKKFHKGKQIVQKSNNCGYLRVGLSKNKKQTKYFVHRLVAENFLNNYENLKQVNHIDGNKQNNHVNNLEWCSGLYNIQHSINEGLRDLKGSNNSQSKLTEEEVFEIKYRISKNITLREIAKQYKVSISVISRIRRGELWKHV